MKEVVIRVENVSKEYRLGTIGHGTLSRELQSYWARMRGSEDPNAKIDASNQSQDLNARFWALKDVSFDVRQGEILGIIGRNGAGKSTLLKIISRVTSPTTGRIKIKGRVASLLEVGTGFHPELTGRENIFLNGAILGMHKGEIEHKFDEIVKFADIDQFIDTPVKRYSSGMYVRLAFAVAAHLEPEILVIDEVLAVGDVGFQKKCLGKMGDVAKEGRTVLFVSHNVGAINNLCSRVIYFESGKIVMDNDPITVVGQYLKKMSRTENEGELLWDEPSSAPGSKRLRLHRVRISSDDGKTRSCLPMDKPIEIEIEFWNFVPNLSNVAVAIIIRDASGICLINTLNTPSANSLIDNWFNQSHQIGLHRACLTLPPGFLNNGQFYVGVFITELDGRSSDVYEDNLLVFEVIDTGYMVTAGMGNWGGLIRMRLPWCTTFVAPLPPHLKGI